MYLSYLSHVKYQGRTKDEPRNDQRTPNHQKVLFIKIIVSFPSLIPHLIPPREPRETTERRAHQLPVKKSTFLNTTFLKRLTHFLTQLTPILKRLTLFLKPLTYLFFKKKSHQKRFFLHISKKKCNFAPKYQKHNHGRVYQFGK